MKRFLALFATIGVAAFGNLVSGANLLSDGSLDTTHMVEVAPGFFLPRPAVWINAGSKTLSGLHLDDLSSEIWAGLQAAERTNSTTRAVVELKDGSRLVGVPLEEWLPVTLDFMKGSISLQKIRDCEFRHEDRGVVVNFRNGDRVTGSLDLERFRLKTLLGVQSVDLAQVDRMAFSLRREGALPAGEGSIFFGGVNWHPWRVMFEVQEDKLVSLPKVRPGFDYGHFGNGRGPVLVSNVGDPDWKDYRVECEFCITGMDPTFNPYRLPLDCRNGNIMFHVVDAKESVNQRGDSLYAFSVRDDGSWELWCIYNQYWQGPVGHVKLKYDSRRTLASGRGLKIDAENGNKYRIEVRGKHIQIWVDGEPIVEVTDEKMKERIGGQILDHGGVGFHWGYDAMGWIRNFSATEL